MFMTKEEKALRNHFTELVEDIFDHFYKYSKDEKQQIRDALAKLESLNYILDKYDKKRKPFSSILGLFDNATGKK